MKTLLRAEPVRDEKGNSRNTGKCANCGQAIRYAGGGGGYWDHLTRGQLCSGKALAAFRPAPAPLTCSCQELFYSFHELEQHYYKAHTAVRSY